MQLPEFHVHDVNWQDFHFLNLSWVDLILLLLLAGVCGGVARSITGQSRGGCLVSVAVGFIGALLAEVLSRWVELPKLVTLNVGGTEFPVIWSIIGACVFMTVLALLTRRRAS